MIYLNNVEVGEETYLKRVGTGLLARGHLLSPASCYDLFCRGNLYEGGRQLNCRQIIYEGKSAANLFYYFKSVDYTLPV